MSDLYDELGVHRQAGADDIKRGYRRAVRECHPDLNPSPAAAHRFRRVSRAYNVLSDPRQRTLYDEFGEESLQPGFDPDLARRQANPSPPSASPFGDMSAFQDVMGSIFNGDYDHVQDAPEPETPAEERATASVPAMVSFVGGITTISVRRAGGRVEPVRIRIKPGARTGDEVVLRGQGSRSSRGVPGRPHGRAAGRRPSPPPPYRR